MTDLEISRKLAEAIGWKTERIIVVNAAGREWLQVGGRKFDYRDWSVAGPIAEKFDCFPAIGYPNSITPWESLSTHDYEIVRSDTPQKAIAMAVIGAKI